MGWRQGPNGPVYVDEGGGAEKSPYAAYGEQNKADASSPYAVYGAPQAQPAGMPGFGSGMAPKGAGAVQAQMTAPQGSPPDGWPGWKWDGAKWSDAHDQWGHNIWVTNNPPGGDPQTRGAEGGEAALYQAIQNVKDGRQTATDSIVDRYSAITMDTGPADQARQAQERGMTMQQAIYDKAMAYDPAGEADAASKRSMTRQMAMARSGAGGAAAQQAQQFQALQNSPAIQAESAAMANQEAQRQTQIAAKAAGDYAHIATGTRSQDINQAQAEVDTGLNVANGISNAIGRDMQLTSEEAQFLGKMQLAFDQQDIDWASLDETKRANLVNEILKKEGLEQQWKQFKASQDVGVLDVVGAIVGTARGAVGTAAAGKTAGLW
jgi:hypothetical protein